MSLSQTIRISIRGMLSNKMRAFLSSLGIIIGVYSVVVLLAIGEGTQKSVLTNIEALGTNLLTISPGGQNQGNVRNFTAQNRNIFTTEHTELISSVSGVAMVAPVVQSSKQVIHGSSNTNVVIYGITPAYASVRNTNIEEGRFISSSENTERQKVAVLGPTVVSTLFPFEDDPIGKTIHIGNTIFTVIGVTKSKGGGSFGNQDNIIYIPLTTAYLSITGSPYLSNISVSIKNGVDMNGVRNDIENTLMNYFGMKNKANVNFTIQSQEEMLSTLGSITGVLKGALSGIAAISLLVGGIGVMNILLVTVTERTKEIGIRKSIGAKNQDIIEQFLIESVILTVFGGLIAILLSYGTIVIINTFLPSIPSTLTFTHLILAFSFSFSIGIFFGIFPAYKAAKMNPIDALRAE